MSPGAGINLRKAVSNAIQCSTGTNSGKRCSRNERYPGQFPDGGLMNLTTQQLADILIGVARSQQAIIEGIEGLKAGFKGTYLAPALDSVAKIRSMGRPMSLQDFPARVLLQCQGRAGPNVEQIVRD